MSEFKLSLPTKKAKPELVDPRVLILFGNYKVGKTTAISKLKNSLVFDLEGGSKYLESMRIDIIEEAKKAKKAPIAILKAYLNQIQEENERLGKYMYKYGVIDTVSALENLVNPLAVRLHKNTPQGKNWIGSDITTLPNGLGWMYVRQALLMVVNDFKETFENVIIVGHVKDKDINLKGEDITERSLSLAGKSPAILCSDADAVGYIYRKDNKTIVNFKPSESLVIDSRAEHLSGKEIVIAENIAKEGEPRNIKTYWERIFINL